MRWSGGFTLVELMLVLFLISLLALTTATVVDQIQDQRRYEETKRRVGEIRQAVVATNTAADGQTIPRGFAADLGRIPNSLQELLEPGALPGWHYDASAGQWAGWRGPYLYSPPEQHGQLAIRDGWGSAGNGPNFGWRVRAIPDAGELWVVSLGKDLADGGDGYSTDYPTHPLVQGYDLLQDLKGWMISVRFENGSPVALPEEDRTFRLHLYYPREGRLDWLRTWPASPAERDMAEYLSLAVRISKHELPPAGVLQRVFPFGAATDKLVPCGVRSLALVCDDTGELVRCAPPTHSVVLTQRAQLAPLLLTFRFDDDPQTPSATNQGLRRSDRTPGHRSHRFRNVGVPRPS